MVVTVNVTQAHIENGKPGESTECAVALALAEKCRDAPRVYCRADGPVVRVIFGTESFESHERGLKKKICDFDDGKQPEPFEFQIDLPEEVLRENSVPLATGREMFGGG